MGAADEDRLRFLFERAPVGMAFATLDGRLTAANPTACRLVGRTEAELCEMPALSVVHPADHANLLARLRALVEGTADDARGEVRLLTADDTHAPSIADP